MERDVYEEYSKLPISFSRLWFLTGTILAGDPAFVECADRADKTGIPGHGHSDGVPDRFRVRRILRDVGDARRPMGGS